jgi:hypothetical protein
MQVKVRFLDTWRYWGRGDEADLEPKLAKMLRKEGYAEILESKQEHPKKNDKKIEKKSVNKPPHDKMLRGGNKQIHKK